MRATARSNFSGRVGAKGARGQALVETALGVVTFVGVLVFALHLYELGYLSLKVQESSAQAAWDITGRSLREGPVESMDHDHDASLEIARLSSALSKQRYADFNGLSSRQNQMEPRLFSKGGDYDMVARAEGSPMIPPIACMDKWVESPQMLGTGVHFRFASSAEVEMVDVPSGMLGERGLMAQPGEGFSLPKHKLCSVGRAVDGACRGNLWIMVDDWSVHDPSECGVTGCSNREYYDAAKAIYDKSGGGGGAASAFAADVTRSASPIDEAKFWLSFKDANSGFEDTTPGGEGKLTWKTGPGPADRPNCFMGANCDR